MTLRYLLDTNTISEPMRKSPNPVIVRNIEQHEAEIALPSPVWHELSYGVHLLPASKKRTKIEDYLRRVVGPSFPLLAYDRIAAEWHAKERARLDRKGVPAPFVDGQIAAIAVANQLILVTRNRRDFERFEGVLIEDWG